MEKEKSNNYKVEKTEKSENNILREEKMVQQKKLVKEEIDKTKEEKEKAKQEESKKSLWGSDKRERVEKKTEREFLYPPLKKEVLATKRPVKVTKGGRRFSFTALLLVKDESKKAVAFANAGGKEMMV